MGYSVDPLSQKHHFGFVGGADRATQFRFTIEISMYKAGVRERRERLLRYNPATAKEMITNAPFEAVNQEPWRSQFSSLVTKYRTQMKSFSRKKASGSTKLRIS